MLAIGVAPTGHMFQKKVFRICRQGNWKLNKDRCLLRYTSQPLFGKVISQQGVCQDSKKVHTLTDMPLLKTRKELQSLWIPNYLSKSLPVTAKVCEPLCKLTPVKANYIWNRMYQDLNKKPRR